MYHYGRPTRNENPSTAQKTPASQGSRSAGMVLVLGCAMLTGFFLHALAPEPQPQQSTVPAGYTAVMSTTSMEAVTPEQVVAAGKEERYHTGAEPFGYMDGEWSLWEYIGDLMVSLLS